MRALKLGVAYVAIVVLTVLGALCTACFWLLELFARGAERALEYVERRWPKGMRDTLIEWAER